MNGNEGNIGKDGKNTQRKNRKETYTYIAQTSLQLHMLLSEMKIQ